MKHSTTQATHLSDYPLVPSGTTGKLKARYTVRDENTTDWDDTYRSETNQTTAWLDFNADQDCVAMFYQYNGVRISYLWSSGTTQLVQSMEYTGEALLLKHTGNLQVYRIDPVAQTKTPEGDLLPSGSTFYTLVPNRMRMVLSIGSGLSVKGYQQVEGEWFGWPTFLQVQ